MPKSITNVGNNFHFDIQISCKVKFHCRYTYSSCFVICVHFVLDSDSVGIWSSMSNSMPQSGSYRARLPSQRSFSQEVGMNSRNRQRTESEGTFYSCESEIESFK